MSRGIDWTELLDLSADWYWEQDAELRFTYFSKAPLEAAGHSAAQYLGLRRWETSHFGVSEAQWAEHRALLERREPFRDFIVGRPAAGGERYVSISGKPCFDAKGTFVGYAGISRDVTARVTAERALRDSEARYRALVDTSPDAVLLLAGGNIAFINRAGARLYGAKRPEDLVGTAIIERVHPEDRASVAERVRTLSERGQPVPLAVLRQRRLDGSVFHAEVVSTPFTVAGRPGAQTIVRDVTERVRADEHIRALNADLEARVRRRTAQLEAANHELEAFSYSVSHDLRAPLRAIRGFAGLLRKRLAATLDEVSRDNLARIEEAGARMSRQIDGMMDLARVASAQLAAGQADLGHLAALVVEELRAGEPGRAVEVAIAPGLEVRGDVILLRQVMQNLLENAWKFTRGREAARIEVGKEQGADQEQFFVRDNGVGFDMAHAENLFAPFQRLHPADEYPGTGIGLATVQRIVARHGGRVWAEGAPGRGATLRFTLGESDVAG